MPNNQKLKLLAVFLCVSVLGMGVDFYTARYYVETKPAQIEGLFWSNPKQLVPFDTVDQHDRSFSVDRLKEKLAFIFFGYTNCSDVCLLTLTTLNQVYEQLGKNLRLRMYK